MIFRLTRSSGGAEGIIAINSLDDLQKYWEQSGRHDLVVRFGEDPRILIFDGLPEMTCNDMVYSGEFFEGLCSLPKGHEGEHEP